MSISALFERKLCLLKYLLLKQKDVDCNNGSVRKLLIYLDLHIINRTMIALYIQEKWDNLE